MGKWTAFLIPIFRFFSYFFICVLELIYFILNAKNKEKYTGTGKNSTFFLANEKFPPLTYKSMR